MLNPFLLFSWKSQTVARLQRYGFVTICLVTLQNPLAFAVTPSAERWQLAQGGKIQGVASKDGKEETKASLSNPRSRKITPSPGIVVTLASATITHRKSISPALEEYERIAPTYADTVPDQWRLVNWCQAKRLFLQRELHLRRIVKLDPEEKTAWQALGYLPSRDGWMTRDELQAREGYFWYKGSYRSNAEIVQMKNSQSELRKKQHADEQILKQEFDVTNRRLLALRDTLVEDNGNVAANKELMSLKGRVAAQLLHEAVLRESHVGMAQKWIAALDAVADNDPTPNMVWDVKCRLASLSLRSLPAAPFETLMACLVKRQDKDLVFWYVNYLTSVQQLAEESDVRIDQVCVVLRRFKSSLVNSIFIESLVSAYGSPLHKPVDSHIDTIGEATVTAGKKERELVTEAFNNFEMRHQNPREWPILLHVLESVTEVSFGFDQKKWRQWNANRLVSTSR